jgi:glycosyltransferase involved in cell wall biosynthesis
MKLLFCCEFYYPSIGGVQEVMRQLAERMVAHGNDVTVATTYLPERNFDQFNGVNIVTFRVSGNLARGLSGEVDAYRRFLIENKFDAILVKAAQQWTFDAMWEVLGRIRSRKVFIPCGFSGLYEPIYNDYFHRIPEILMDMDHLIFYSENYRDVNFARALGITHYSIVPNGASEVEFNVARDGYFRRRHGIPEESFVYMTVGSLTGVKGHLEILRAFDLLKTDTRPLILILNGNRHVTPEYGQQHLQSDDIQQVIPEPGPQCPQPDPPPPQPVKRPMIIIRAFKMFQEKGIAVVVSVALQMSWNCIRKFFKLVRNMSSTEEHNIEYYIEKINADPSTRKRVLAVNLQRSEVVQAFLNADLFVFASNIEYSPLVLYESAAAGLPFVTVPVGNTREITRWTGGGWICPAKADRRGYTRVRPKVLARHMLRGLKSPKLLEQLGRTGRDNWLRKFTWDIIVRRYEAILKGTGEAQ